MDISKNQYRSTGGMHSSIARNSWKLKMKEFLKCSKGFLRAMETGGIDFVVRDLEYHVIGLKTQCLWVIYIPIPGLHTNRARAFSEILPKWHFLASACNLNFLRAKWLSRCLSVLDFWKVNFGAYYKLEKKIYFGTNLIFCQVGTWFLLPV